jgi:AcrR family transcriptional regulator
MRRNAEIPLKNLQTQHTDATRKLILEWAMHLLVAEKQTPFSHEAVAEAAGISSRTVYRHFPSRDELISALWHEFQLEHQSSLPKTEKELLQKTAELYQHFDRYEGLVRAYLSCSDSQAISEDQTVPSDSTQGLDQARSAEVRKSLGQSLERLLGDMDEEHSKLVTAAFLTLGSPQAWQVMRDQGGLSGVQAGKAAQLTMAALMEALRPPVPRKASVPDTAEAVAIATQPAVPAKAKTQAALGESGQSAAKWKGVYDNPVITTLKKLIPKE